MPLYSLRCPACGITYECHEPFARRELIDCINQCGVRQETNFEAGAAKPERQWDEKEGRSLRFAFSNLEALRKDVPSAELDAKGNMVFKSDRHQRQVYREMDAARKKIENEKIEQRSDMLQEMRRG